jgi:hypothetical protein
VGEEDDVEESTDMSDLDVRKLKMVAELAKEYEELQDLLAQVRMAGDEAAALRAEVAELQMVAANQVPADDPGEQEESDAIAGNVDEVSVADDKASYRCGECEEAFPSFKELYSHIENKDIIVLSYNGDNDAIVLQGILRVKLRSPTIMLE